MSVSFWILCVTVVGAQLVNAHDDPNFFKILQTISNGGFQPGMVPMSSPVMSHPMQRPASPQPNFQPHNPFPQMQTTPVVNNFIQQPHHQLPNTVNQPPNMMPPVNQPPNVMPPVNQPPNMIPSGPPPSVNGASHNVPSQNVAKELGFDHILNSVSLFGSENCGRIQPTVTNYVAGGKAIHHHDHPWYAQIIIHNTEISESETYCGGTLIAPEWVLTAAHCYDDMRRDRLARATHVIFRGLPGLHRKFNAKAEYVFIHENYVAAMLPWEAEVQGLKPGPYNDLALIKLSSDSIPSYIKPLLIPVCIPAPNTPVHEGTVCKVMGHGFMNAEDEKRFHMPSQLQAAKVRISSNPACQGDVESKNIKEKINEKTICVRGPIHPCVGDSGGPLVCTGQSRRHIDGADNDDNDLNDENVLSDSYEPRKWYLVGVTSFAVSTDGHDNCGTFKSAVFGLVSSQLDWIRRTILAHQSSPNPQHYNHFNNNFQQKFFKRFQ